jgi:cytochrome c oxidase subunit 2
MCGAAGCSGVQSALDPAGREAERIAELFWWMTGGAGLIWLAVVALALHAYARPAGYRSTSRDRWFVVVGGFVVPTVVLTVLLLFGLALLPAAVARAPDGSLQVSVVGEQWWWRVRYITSGETTVELANEVRLPVGEPVQFRLASPDVIHSFWIPSLGGKMDMIPGRITSLTLRPTTTGVFRGACAEYCGTSHALMAFSVAVMPAPEFRRWLDRQAQPAPEPVDSAAVRGRDVFIANGCAACHTIRGTAARGVIGPDLTHAGSRLSIGAGLLPNDAEAFWRWITSIDAIKPGAHMPHFRMLPDDERRALAAYLESLQ